MCQQTSLTCITALLGPGGNAAIDDSRREAAENSGSGCDVEEVAVEIEEVG